MEENWTVQRRYWRPEYALYAFEVVRTVILEVWWEESTRWLRIEILKDLAGNHHPYSVRIYVRGKHETDPWAELPSYPKWAGHTPDAALKECLEGLAERGEVALGVETRDNRVR